MDCRTALLTVLDQVDYTNGACRLNEMVGACLPKEVISLARQAIADESIESKKIFNFDEEIKWILGRPNFMCGGIATALRKSGMEIPQKAEEEQAVVIYWMLEMYTMHGKGWRKAGEEFLGQVNK